MSGGEAIEPFALAIPQADLDDLQRRLAAVRWPDAETAEPWVQGVPLAEMKRVVDYWRNGYDWRRCETALNGLGQSRTVIDGLGIHFLHVKSKEPNALPILLTHGWPGSVIEFVKAIPLLTDPVAHGGKAEDAFDVVVPSLPGYGFSDKPGATGWDVARIAKAWAELMQRLGHDRWVAQGGDWGAAVTTALGTLEPAGLIGIHLNMPIAFPTAEDRENLSADEQERVAGMEYHGKYGRGYSELQSTRPQTLGYLLADSPVGQAAWIYEKYREWADCGGEPATLFSMDEMLDNIMLYWLPDAGASSARLYWQSLTSFAPKIVSLPVGVSLFPREIFRPARRWAERMYPNLIHWNELDRGGHFAAFEQPELFAQEMRACFRTLR